MKGALRPLSVGWPLPPATERPAWRSDILPATSDMLAGLAAGANAFADADAYLTETYRESMSYFFVYSSNRIEHVGTQTYGETAAVLRGADIVAGAAGARALSETRQTKRALDDLQREHAERSAEAQSPNELLYLTVSSILQSHRTLMTGIFAPDAHGYRAGHAQTETDTGIYYYLAPERIAPALDDLVDRMNAIAAAAGAALSPAQRFAYAAKWLYEFLSIHPFSDGNGRCGRLWAAYLLLELLPFPVTILPTLRTAYIRAMENAHLADIQAILVESAWTHMRNFLQAAEAVGGATA